MIGDPSERVIFRGGLQSGRRLAGAALAVVGAAIAAQLVRAIVSNRQSTHAGWSAYLPVVLMFGGVALAFLLPGALMMLHTRLVRVDLENREVVEQITYLGLGRTRRYRLASFKKIVLVRRVIRRHRAGRTVGTGHARRSYPYFVVELVADDGKPVRIVADHREAPMRDAAVKLAALTHLAVDDQVDRERAREAAGLDPEDAEN